LPALGQWLLRFGPASLLSIGVTFVVLRYTQRETLRESVETAIKVPELSAHARTAACGIGLTAGALMAASQHGTPLGWPTCLCGVLTVAVVLVKKREAPWNTVKDISWGVLPLVAGLFVLVAGLEHVGVIAWLSRQLHDSTAHDRATTAWTSGLGIAFACNLMNNLPAGLIAGFTVNAAHAPPQVAGAMLVGVDLGPNLSVTGSLATILWLAALRREGQEVGAWEFLKIGLLVMPAALIPALAAVVIGVR